jgi:GT2 family glycosyltransferase
LTDYPLVSIVILNYNGESCLMPCLQSVLQACYPNFEVILVDNASKDNSLATAQETFGSDSRLKVIQNAVNMGFSGGNNVGFEYSKGEFVVFLNNDTIVEPQWLRPLVEAMTNDPTIGLSQSLLLAVGGEKIVNAGWIFDNYLISKRELCKGKPSDLKLKPVFEISFACGASMMVRREIVETMGLFVKEIPFFYDDTLLSLKTWLQGKRVVTVSASKVQHIVGATNVWQTRFTTYHLSRATICLLFDVYPRLFDFSRAFFVNAFHGSINSFFCLKNRNIAAVLGNIEAFVWSLKNFRYLWRKKLFHWSKAKISTSALEGKFMRIKFPVAFYLFPSTLGDNCSAYEFRKYENRVIDQM